MTRFQFVFIVLLNVFCGNAQDIITKDGQSMGAKSIFMEVCLENMTANMSEVDKSLYSVNNYCNCMADELLPTLTRSQIEHYFMNGYMDEMLANKQNYQIIKNCVQKNMISDKFSPEFEADLESKKHLVDSLVILLKYENLFYSILDKRIQEVSIENNWVESKSIELKSKVRFEDFEYRKFYAVYSKYSKEELYKLIEIYSSSTNNEIFEKKYEDVILIEMQHGIDNLILNH